MARHDAEEKRRRDTGERQHRQAREDARAVDALACAMEDCGGRVHPMSGAGQHEARRLLDALRGLGFTVTRT